MNESTDQPTNDPTNQPTFQIGIDARLSGVRHGGIGRYIQNLILELLKLDNTSVKWHFFFFDEQQAKEVLGASFNDSDLTVHYAPIRHYTLREQLSMPGIFSSINLDLLHIPHFNIPYFYSGKIVVTIHDLLWHEYQGSDVTTLPSWQYRFKHSAYKWLTGKAVKNAQQIFVPAETIKKIVTKYYPEVESKIVVTKEGVSPQFHIKKNAKKTNTKFLLYVGSLYPHKNITVVLDALQKLPDYQLILVGARDVFADKTLEEVKKKNLEQQVTFLGYQTDENIVELIQQAQALIQPSLSEGFGLTGLEAMSAGGTVICSDIPIFKEIYQDGAIYFNPHDSLSFVKAVKNSESNKAELSKKSQHVVSQYSWKKMAEETLQSYFNILQ